MKRLTISAVVSGFAAICGFALSPALAGGGSADAEFKMMDTNGDGKLSADEHTAGARKMFDTMDSNKDGKVTSAEMDGAHEQVTGRKASKTDMSSVDKIKTIDTNSDGVLSAEEHAAGATLMFDRMDTDRDGLVSKTELAAGHAMMRKGADKNRDNPK